MMPLQSAFRACRSGLVGLVRSLKSRRVLTCMRSTYLGPVERDERYLVLFLSQDKLVLCVVGGCDV